MTLTLVETTLKLKTPLGIMTAAASDEGVTRLQFDEQPNGHRNAFSDFPLRSTASASHLDRLRDELDAYFAGGRQTFSVPLAPSGSEFELRAWEYLCTIPFGATRSYGAQAKAVGAPDAARAVGRANGVNDIAIVIPCHRVIGASGRLIGYAGGLHRKQWLLEHERRVVGASLFS